MTTRNVLFGLVGSGIACILLAGVGQATVARAFVSTTVGHTNPQAIPVSQPRPDDSRFWRTNSRARLGQLPKWINDHPVRSRIVKTAAMLAVLLAIQLLVRPSQRAIHPESVPAQLQHGRHHRWSDGPA